MAGMISFVLGAAIPTAVILAGAIVLWLTYGRKGQAEDKAIGGLEQMAHFRATNSVDVMTRRLR